MNASTRDDALNLVEQAQEKLFETIELLRQYVDLTADRHTEAYILDHLVIMASADHGFLSRESNLGEVIDGLLHPDEDDEEEEEDYDDDDEQRHWGSRYDGIEVGHEADLPQHCK
jgi:hypothetical protein